MGRQGGEWRGRDGRGAYQDRCCRRLPTGLFFQEPRAFVGTYRSGNTLARGLSGRSSVTMAPCLGSASQSWAGTEARNRALPVRAVHHGGGLHEEHHASCAEGCEENPNRQIFTQSTTG